MKVTLNMTTLQALKRSAPDAASASIGKLAQDTETYAKDNMNTKSPAPVGQFPGVDTGNLKNSIVASRQSAYTWVVDVDADYGADLEYGTHKMGARPFLLPSVLAIVEKAPKELIEAIEP